MRRYETRKLTLTAAFSALSVALLYFSAVMPTGQLGFLGVASLAGVAAVCEYGLAGGGAVFVITAALGFLAVPERGSVVLYCVFFGVYPIIKAVSERTRTRVLEWIIKLALFNCAVTAALFAFSLALFDRELTPVFAAMLYFAGNAAFVLFDIGVSRVISVYMAKIYPKIHSNK